MCGFGSQSSEGFLHIELLKLIIFRRSEERRAQDVTSKLKELRGVLQTQVARSEETTQELTQTSTTIRKTKTEMEGIGSEITAGSSLISKYDRRELTDKVMILVGLLLFFGVVLYIIKQRLLGWLW